MKAFRLTALAAALLAAAGALQAAPLPYTRAGAEIELVNLGEIDGRVRRGETEKPWQDGTTAPGWWARSADKPATSLQLTHGSNQRGGVQVFVDKTNHTALALGSFTTTSVPSVMLAVGVRNGTGSALHSVTLSLRQVQWFGGSAAMHDSYAASWKVGGDTPNGGKPQNLEKLDLRHFVNGSGGLKEPLTFDKTIRLENIDWPAGQILWLRWIDRRADGGNAGAGIASLKLVAGNSAASVNNNGGSTTAAGSATAVKNAAQAPQHAQKTQDILAAQDAQEAQNTQGSQNPQHGQPAQPAQQARSSSAQNTADTKYRWVPAQQLHVEGRGWDDTESFFDRLPRHAKGKVRPGVWGLSQHSSGMAVRFTSDTTSLGVRWNLRKDNLQMPHMPATGVSGLDLYLRQDGEWKWVGNARPGDTRENERGLLAGLKAQPREYLLFLPLYNGVNSVDLRVDKGASISPVPPAPAKAAPVVVYGTSITQGACASRPGMSYTAILRRKLDREFVNLGFSANGRTEPEMIELLCELNPAAYVLDSLPNLQPSEVERVGQAIDAIRKKHPQTPIILIESIAYGNGWISPARKARYEGSNNALDAVYTQRAADPHLFIVRSDALLGPDNEATVDGTHPSDLGFRYIAEAIEPVLQKALAHSGN